MLVVQYSSMLNGFHIYIHMLPPTVALGKNKLSENRILIHLPYIKSRVINTFHAVQVKIIYF